MTPLPPFMVTKEVKGVWKLSGHGFTGNDWLDVGDGGWTTGRTRQGWLGVLLLTMKTISLLHSFPNILSLTLCLPQGSSFTHPLTQILSAIHNSSSSKSPHSHSSCTARNARTVWCTGKREEGRFLVAMFPSWHKPLVCKIEYVTYTYSCLVTNSQNTIQRRPFPV